MHKPSIKLDTDIVLNLSLSTATSPGKTSPGKICFESESENMFHIWVLAQWRHLGKPHQVIRYVPGLSLRTCSVSESEYLFPEIVCNLWIWVREKQTPCVCIRACVCVYMCAVYTYPYTYSCTSTCKYLHTNIHLQMKAHAKIHDSASDSESIYLNIRWTQNQLSLFVHAHTYIHTYVKIWKCRQTPDWLTPFMHLHKYMHTYIYTYIHKQAKGQLASKHLIDS